MKRLDVPALLALQGGALLFDVRSPSEFEKGHIPGAISLPLFDDEERARVGTLYKQEGRNPAILEGLDVVGPKMRSLVEAAQELVGSPGDRPADGSTDREVDLLVHCWRGGMRSGSVAWLFETYGWRVGVLDGGYKAYRNWALDVFERPFRWVVIGGRTGSAKTEVLLELRDLGEQVIDLEGLANHRGSAFGALGLPDQPSQQTFENRLALRLDQLEIEREVWVEDESRMVGTCCVPQVIMDAKARSPMFVLDIPVERRLDHLVEIYGEADIAGLVDSFERIERRLGNQRMDSAVRALEAGDIRAAALQALDYYDRAYDHGLARRNPSHLTTIESDEEPAAIARELRRRLRERHAVAP